MIKISLVIVSYNRAEPLMRTLQSVAQQKTERSVWECLVVDNNSSDHTRANVEAFMAEHPDINMRYCFEGTQGVSYARNTGIRQAKGEIIAYVDDDELIVPEFLDAYIDVFERFPDVMSAGGKNIAEYPEGKPKWMSKYAEEPIANSMDFGEKVKPFPKTRVPGAGNMAVRKKVFDEIAMFDTGMGRSGGNLTGGEESDLFERMAAKQMKCYYVPAAVMYHIIPASKLNKDYFCRLAYNNGRGQWARAVLRHRRCNLMIREFCKWIATLLLCLVHRPIQSKYLLLMRKNISKGIIHAARKI